MISESLQFSNEIYKLSQTDQLDLASEYVEYAMNRFESNKLFGVIDSIFFNLDLSKVNIHIAKMIIKNTYSFFEFLYLRNSFIENCKNIYGPDRIKNI